MTAEYIAFHAAERPDAVAFVNNGCAITYAQLARDIASVAGAAREFGLARGRAVAVGCDDFYLHWLLLLAFERLGVATASFHTGEREGCAPLFALTDLVLCQGEFPDWLAPRQYRITPGWVESVLARGPERELEDIALSDDRVRIERTSGTTGAVKCLARSRRAYERCIEKWIWRCGLARDCRYLITMPFSVEGMYHHVTACARAGGTVIVENRIHNVAAALAQYGITQATLLPIHLKSALDRLPANFAKPPDLAISTLGAAVSPALRARATERLASHLYETYGANEVGFVCSSSSHDETRGYTVFPGARVEVVDEADRPVPAGQPGRIRVRTDTMADGYIGDPAATQRMFKNGWFYPGDLGIIREPGHLIVLAREDELMNIGGNKIFPERIETSVAAHASLDDVGVSLVRNADGIEELRIGVSGAAVDDQTLLRQVQDAVRHLHLEGFLVVKLPRIPRTATGKIQRTLLKEALAATGPQ